MPASSGVAASAAWLELDSYSPRGEDVVMSIACAVGTPVCRDQERTHAAVVVRFVSWWNAIYWCGGVTCQLALFFSFHRRSTLRWLLASSSPSQQQALQPPFHARHDQSRIHMPHIAPTEKRGVRLSLENARIGWQLIVRSNAEITPTSHT